MLWQLAFRAGVVAATLLIGSSATLAQTSNMTTIRFIASPSDDMLPFLYAQSTGMFKQAGLNVEVSSASSGAIVTQAIVGGADDIAKTSLSTIIAAHARGIPFVMIAPAAIHLKSDAAKAQVNAAILVAVNSPLKTALDLQGKTMSCTAIGDIGYLGLRTMVDAQGGDSSTIKWVEIPIPAVGAALDAGRVDAAVSAEPFMTKDLSGGKIRVLVDMLDGYPGPVLEGAYFSMHDFAAAHPDALKRFAAVLRQAAVYTNAHTAETIPLLVASNGMDPELAAKMHHAVVALAFDPAQIQPIIDAAAKYKVIPQKFNARELF
jgi:NitT/TauT family transport system substrate-binding protein